MERRLTPQPFQVANKIGRASLALRTSSNSSPLQGRVFGHWPILQALTLKSASNQRKNLLCLDAPAPEGTPQDLFTMSATIACGMYKKAFGCHLESLKKRFVLHSIPALTRTVVSSRSRRQGAPEAASGSKTPRQSRRSPCLSCFGNTF